MKDSQLKKLAVYIQMELDGVLDDKQFLEMVTILKSSPEARRYYARAITTISSFYGASILEKHQEEIDIGIDSYDSELWQALSKDERQAKTIELVKESEPIELIRGVRDRKKMLRSREKNMPISFWGAILSLAALLIMIVYVYLNPRVSYEVATIVDFIKPEWSSSLPLEKGGRLTASHEQIELQKGIVEIESDKGVKIIVEAPAKFSFLSSEEIELYHGRLFAFVPESGSGFTVQTNNSKIIDLGTKFGVYADMKGETELHLFKGKTLLISGQKQYSKTMTEVSTGRALHIDYTGQSIKDVPLRSDVFVHEIDSQARLLWRGQKQINLADVIGGGNGFGSGRQNVGIDPTTGNFRKAVTETMRYRNVYTPVESNVFVDGVFVPNGSKEQVVSSAGHLFADCPSTNGYFYMDITNTPTIPDSQNIDSEGFSVFLNGVNYSQKENPCIFMHANSGITFDLNQYRSRLRGAKIVSFQSELGISDSAQREYVADLWVLVDGQVRYHNTEPMKRGDVEKIIVEISDQDRFLTLMSTDGSIYDLIQDQNAIGYDWGLFGQPFLILE